MKSLMHCKHYIQTGLLLGGALSPDCKQYMVSQVMGGGVAEGGIGVCAKRVGVNRLKFRFRNAACRPAIS